MSQPELIDSKNQLFTSYWARLNAPVANSIESNFGLNLNNNDVETRIIADHSFVVAEQGAPVLGCKILRLEGAPASNEDWWLQACPTLSKQYLDSENHHIQAHAQALFTKHFRQLVWDLNPPRLELTDDLQCGLVSPVSQHLLTVGAQPLTISSQTLDLQLSPKALLRDVSKPYRSYIHWGLRHLSFETVAADDSLDCRSRFGWRWEGVERVNHSCGQQVLGYRNGFTVYGSDSKGIVAWVRFETWGREAVLAESAQINMRDATPCLHSVFWMAIMHAQKAGYSQIKMNETFGKPRDGSIGLSSFGGLNSQRLQLSLTR